MTRENTNKQQRETFNYQKLDIQIPIRGLVTDFSPLFQPEGTYTFALNATKVSMNGVVNSLSNEESNRLIAAYPSSGINPNNFEIVEAEQEEIVNYTMPGTIVVSNYEGIWDEDIQMHNSGETERNYVVYFKLVENNYVYTHITYIQDNQLYSSIDIPESIINDKDIVNIYVNLEPNSAFELNYRYKIELDSRIFKRVQLFKEKDIVIHGQYFNNCTNITDFGIMEDNSKSASIVIIEEIRNNKFGIRFNNVVTKKKSTVIARKIKDKTTQESIPEPLIT